MSSLILPLLERVGLIILLANLLMNGSFYKNIMYHRKKKGSMVILIVTFSIFAIISNFTGIKVMDQSITRSGLLLAIEETAFIANTRTLTIGISGIIGGPIVGICVGLISGTVRVFQGGAFPQTFFISSFLVGLVSGIVGKRSLNRNTYPTVVQGIILGAALESIQMLSIYLFFPQRQEAVDLLQIIAVPMILLNTFGTGIFLSIILSTLKQEESMKAIQTHDVLELANSTLPYFRQGLNKNSSSEAASYIKDFMKVSAVSITNKQQILAHAGLGSEHHIPMKEIISDLTKEVLMTGKIHLARTKKEIGCSHGDCPLEVAIVVPLFIKERVVGTFKLYFDDSSRLTHVEEQLARGLGDIFSSQLELGEMESQQNLLKDIEIKSLQAQVNPHFLFNSINTISALIRIDSEKARNLLLQLGNYFRFNLQGVRNNLIPLRDELAHLAAYLSIEQTRFPNRYEIYYSIDEEMNEAYVPPFMIQILVENAIKHAFKERKENNRVEVSISRTGEHVQLCVADNGFGIDSGKIHLIGKEEVDSACGTGSALENLNRRLVSLFGIKSKLRITTSDSGTKFKITMPYVTRKAEARQRMETNEHINY